MHPQNIGLGLGLMPVTMPTIMMYHAYISRSTTGTYVRNKVELLSHNSHLSLNLDDTYRLVMPRQ